MSQTLYQIFPKDGYKSTQGMGYIVSDFSTTVLHRRYQINTTLYMKIKILKRNIVDVKIFVHPAIVV